VTTAFADMHEALFGDPNLGIAATYRVGGVGTGAAVQILREMPDVTREWSQTVIAAGAVIFRLRVADVPEPEPGDTIEIDGAVYELLDTAPVHDAMRLTQTVIARRP